MEHLDFFFSFSAALREENGKLEKSPKSHRLIFLAFSFLLLHPTFLFPSYFHPFIPFTLLYLIIFSFRFVSFLSFCDTLDSILDCSSGPRHSASRERGWSFTMDQNRFLQQLQVILNRRSLWTRTRPDGY